jgi:hypothetical protein
MGRFLFLNQFYYNVRINVSPTTSYESEAVNGPAKFDAATG